MKRLSSLIVFALIILCGIGAKAQNSPEILPPSPEASSLSKFVEIPVSHYSGLPTINIPFYTIDLDGLQIPISLSYHARGIRVEEIAPRVGIGWALNYGGMVSRQIRGKADDTWNSDEKGYLTQNYYESFETNESTRIGVWSDATNDIGDLVPDQFMFNFLGYSGKFIFDQKTKEPLLQNYADFKIEPIYGNATTHAGIKAWVVTNENGYKFYFGEYNNSSTIANRDEIERSFAYTTDGVLDFGRPILSNDYNSWQLVAIESPRGNKVEFIYELESTQFHKRSYDKRELNGTTISSYFSRIRSKEYKIKEIVFNEGHIVFTKDNVEREDINFGYSLKEIEIKDLNAISVAKYSFNYSYNYDTSTGNVNPTLMSYDTKARKRLFLDNIEKIAPNGTTEPFYSFEYINKQELPNRFSNAQDVWGYYNGKTNGQFLTFFDYGGNTINRKVDTIKAKTGLLRKINLPTGGSKEFEFEANKAKVPDYFKDLYYDGINPTTPKSVGMVKGPTHYVGNKTYEIPFTIENKISGSIFTIVQFMGNFGTCSSTEQLVNCNYKVRIQGANGGYSIFMGSGNSSALPPGDYKLIVRQLTGVDDPYDFFNGFAVNISWNESLDPNIAIYSGGNRVKKTILNSEWNGTIEKSYEYLTNLNETSGLLFSLPSYYFIQKTILGVPVIDAYGARPGSPLTYEQGNHVGYSHVTEYINGNTIGDGGKNEYSFTAVPDSGDFYKFPYTISMDNEWMRGKLLTSKTYKKTLGGYDLINEIENKYKYANFPIYYHITNPPLPQEIVRLFYKKDKLQFHIPLIIFKPGNDPNPANWDHNDYKVYNLTGGTQHLYSSKITSYYNTLPVSTETKYYYDYDNHYQSNQSETNTSDSKPIITKIFYPDDIISTSSLGFDNLTPNEKAAIDKLKAPSPTNLTGEHRTAVPIQVEVYKDEDEDGFADSSELLSTQRTNYRTWPNGITLPEYTQSSKDGTPLDNRVQFHNYDNKGNPIEVSKTDGTSITYIWGYNQEYPVVKIENATYASVIATLTAAELTAIKDGTYNQSTMMATLNKIRTGLPDAMVTTYTYDPLVGATSITDPKGYTIYYEYDDFNRLEFIKDDTGKLLSENKYNYKN
ncbi:hypothetical protein Q4Q34_10135 [Flavivirga abyssicola]|uniref:hypothetical protein n=1 Tax=Flavivirga abyssicola TaxID=3063533 RepID=UPI0026DF2F13|nr:hypothetical protein [Flavivirga sp. MEBiC07777]WVK11584.1 hypothetical protein Q4Q34_10135 [Flavivirga sp. MEBiC07777]